MTKRGTYILSDNVLLIIIVLIFPHLIRNSRAVDQRGK